MKNLAQNKLSQNMFMPGRNKASRDLASLDVKQIAFKNMQSIEQMEEDEDIKIGTIQTMQTKNNIDESKEKVCPQKLYLKISKHGSCAFELQNPVQRSTRNIKSKSLLVKCFEKLKEAPKNYIKIERKDSCGNNCNKSSRNNLIAKAVSNCSYKLNIPKASRDRNRKKKAHESYIQKCTKRISHKADSSRNYSREDSYISKVKISNQRVKAVERVTLELNSQDSDLQNESNETISINGPSLCHRIVSKEADDFEKEFMSNVLDNEQNTPLLNFETLYDVPNEDNPEIFMRRSLPKITRYIKE